MSLTDMWLDNDQLLVVAITTRGGQHRREAYFTPSAAERAHLKAIEKGHRATITLHRLDNGQEVHP